MELNTVTGLLVYKNLLTGEFWPKEISLSCEEDADKIMQLVLEAGESRRTIIVDIRGVLTPVPINIIVTENKRRTWYRLLAVDIWEEK